MTCAVDKQRVFGRLFIRLDLSFAPSGLDPSLLRLPTACAVGCILSPLRGLLDAVENADRRCWLL